ncbi:hypothetical protein CtesDRAFT_PD0432 [Comamonas testosteroni KF-1]|uniref:Uncharacterized protein n=1 Tax=Comamonas testosteroni (strain DSM 14576 / KF-1) TaxID=399795 RepID=B7WTB8_COMTK|nr:hypothetical protein CtesDRAFT_PD0432 [Comamonas testosteroni KF-1]
MSALPIAAGSSWPAPEPGSTDDTMDEVLQIEAGQ